MHGRGWTAAQLSNVAGLVQLQRLPYNTVVVEQGTQADCTFFIKTGEVRVVRRMEADTPFWAALHKDPRLGPKYAPASTKHRRSECGLSCAQFLPVFFAVCSCLLQKRCGIHDGEGLAVCFDPARLQETRCLYSKQCSHKFVVRRLWMSVPIQGSICGFSSTHLNILLLL